ncbi:MAG: hypothetical protein M0C28_05130 [Candidatus Moduliflexus flocculans]|nr:hypothetical protein [Candidatus Moduliflexus flocculans]
MGLVLGSLAYYIVFPPAESLYPADVRLFAGFLHHLTDPVFEPGTIIAFLLCFFALSVNDIGSVQAVVPLLNPPDMHRRVTRGLTVTGLMNIAAGGLGVVGPVNFSLSPGLIATLRVCLPLCLHSGGPHAADHFFFAGPSRHRRRHSADGDRGDPGLHPVLTGRGRAERRL